MSRAGRLHALALLVGVLPVLAIALVGCGGGGGSTTVTETETVVETTGAEPTTDGGEGATGGGEEASGAEATGGVSSPTVHLRRFQSPSGNIGCALYGGGARCDIDKHSWTPPPRPSSCSLDYGQGLTVDESGSGVVCAGDTTLDAKLPVLAYGSSSTVDGVTCASRAAGISCRDGAGHGFFLSAQRYRLF